MSADTTTPFERAIAYGACSHGWDWRTYGTCPACEDANIAKRMDGVVTPLASRQPELNPQPFKPSYATLHYQLQDARAQLERERAQVAELAAALRRLLEPHSSTAIILARSLLAKLDAGKA